MTFFYRDQSQSDGLIIGGLIKFSYTVTALNLQVNAGILKPAYDTGLDRLIVIINNVSSCFFRDDILRCSPKRLNHVIWNISKTSVLVSFK